MVENNGNRDYTMEYIEKFDRLPAIPMMQCSGTEDPQYIKMLQYAVEHNTPVTEEIEEMFFPTDAEALY